MAAALPSIPVEHRSKRPIRWGLIVLLTPLVLMSPVAGALGIRVLAVEAFESAGASMEPTLLDGDRILVDKSAFGLWIPFANEAPVEWAAPEPGDVVVVRSPFDHLDIVKRIIGVPGDRIEITDDVVLRNGEPLLRRVLGPCDAEAAQDCELSEEGLGSHVWRTTQSTYGVPDNLPEVVVPPEHVFVLGDHRDRSNDSRNPRIGMIPFSQLKGRALYVYWSNGEGVRWDRIGQEVR